jgi:general secretion pathway protein E
MGVEDYLLASSLLGVMAQRLVRNLCLHCRRPAEATVLSSEGARANKTREIPIAVYEAQGCDACASTGYRGRNGIFELLMVNEGVRQLILKRSSADAIKNYAVAEQGMRTLREDGWRKVREGGTSVAEVLRVTQDE